MKKLLLITIVLSILGCHKFEYGELETFVIEQGDHYSNFPKYHKDKKSVFCEVVVDKSWRYGPESDCGWHKLIGLIPNLILAEDVENDPLKSQMSHEELFALSVHSNSARIAWRYKQDNDQVLFATYRYKDGERLIEEIFHVPIDGTFECHVAYSKDDEAWKMGLVYGEKEFVKWYPAGKFNQKKFYWLGPYFGCDATAPHKMIFQFKFRTG